MYIVTLKSKDNHRYECKVEVKIYNEDVIEKIAFEKIKKDIPDYESFNYKLESIKIK